MPVDNCYCVDTDFTKYIAVVYMIKFLQNEA